MHASHCKKKKNKTQQNIKRNKIVVGVTFETMYLAIIMRFIGMIIQVER